MSKKLLMAVAVLGTCMAVTGCGGDDDDDDSGSGNGGETSGSGGGASGDLCCDLMQCNFGCSKDPTCEIACVQQYCGPDGSGCSQCAAWAETEAVIACAQSLPGGG